MVFLAAAKVGGIVANNTLRAEFLYDNLAIAANVIHAAHLHGTEKLMFLGSSCIYPKLAPQPMREDAMLTGPLEPTNEPYAIAKIAGIKMAEAYRRQYGSDFISVMPTNLYGPGDNYHPEYSHVVAALIRRFHEAKVAGVPNVVVWGTGTPRREFLYVDDMADACVHLMKTYSHARDGQYRHRRGHRDRGFRARGGRHRRLQRHDQLRHLASRRHAAEAARRQPACKARLARAHLARGRHQAGVSGVSERAASRRRSNRCSSVVIARSERDEAIHGAAKIGSRGLLRFARNDDELLVATAAASSPAPPPSPRSAAS